MCLSSITGFGFLVEFKCWQLLFFWLWSSAFMRQHAIKYSKGLLFLSGCRYGGIYMDMDVIVLKPLDALHNTLGSELSTDGELRLNGAILAFDKSRWECELVHRILCKRVLAFSLLLSMVMPMSLGLCLPLNLCSLLELFQMNKECT